MERKRLDQRLDRLVHLYDHFDQVIDQLPVNVPASVRKQIEKFVFKNDDLKGLIEDIKTRRPPRFILMGRTGVGKSSLINSLFGKYIAKTSAIQIGTKEVERYQYEDNGDVLFEVIDTRGLKESVTRTEDKSAEQALKVAIESFEPDAVFHLMNATERAAMDDDLMQIKRIKPLLGKDVPILTVLTHVDNIEPARIKEAENYPQIKLDRIDEKIEQVKHLMNALQIDVTEVIAVSSYIEWTHDAPETLFIEERKKLAIDFDGRYQIDYLLDFLEHNMDFQASIHLMMSTRIDRAIKKITKQLIQIFSTAASTVALTPIPVSDMSVLIPLQLIMVSFIAYLSGRDLTRETLKDFLLSIGGVGSLGYSFKLIAQQGSKLLNVVLPGSGSVISSTIAFSGTYAMGKAAEAYYLDGMNKKDLKRVIRQADKEAKQKEKELTDD
ncbi:small GTP-binding protein [Streptohalobacillus salinus]|uniref:Small GTP-binding protein n=1 Tax=Streptohalobacillus salinus TaxID=621096 RepID=A0A2V3WEX6_9BACI|nr:GTPase [Streptohalobacillus salinus]PXW93203.1 small GTP-binding protein [Streptohalobacillus salinus]